MAGLTRRDVLRASVLAAAGISTPALLSACASAARPRATATSSTPSTAPPTTEPFDPSRPWWLQGDFAPVTREVESLRLEVAGALPPELDGLYVRNGSNPQSGDSPHWFFGDGMVHGVRLRAGRAEWYRNRYVHTALYDAKEGFGGSGAPGGTQTQSNVSVFWHGGTLRSSGEVGYPYALRPSDLSTIGVDDFAGRLTTSCTAHPKIDPRTGRLHFFGYGFTPPYLTYHVADTSGALVHSEEIPVRASTMMHDFAITESDVVFWELPVLFDLQAAVQWVKNTKSGAFPYRWDPDYGARLGVMPLGGPAEAIRWYEIDPCYVFHGVNAYRSGDNVIADVCRLDSVFDRGQILGSNLSLRRWTIDTVRGVVHDDIVATHDPGELPSRDPRRVGRQHRHGYFVQSRTNDHTVDLGGLIKHDYDRGTRVTWDPGPDVHTGEWLFVPAGADPADDAGYLLTFGYDAARDRSDLLVVDATDVRRGPIARVAMPQRVPYGFHATWVPGAAV